MVDNLQKKFKVKTQSSLGVLVEEKIKELIEDKTFPEGSKLPPESELAQIIGVSRTSLREALQNSEKQAYISRTPGVGTFVRVREKLNNPLDANLGATEVIRSFNLNPGTIEIKVVDDQANETIAQKLKVPVGIANNFNRTS